MIDSHVLYTLVCQYLLSIVYRVSAGHPWRIKYLGRDEVK